jgi:hypothetical protein
MTELDSLFKLDGDLDSLDKNLHEKYACNIQFLPSRVTLTSPRKQAVTTQTQELEALEARLRAAEDRLKQAKSNSPPRRKDPQRRSPLEGTFPAADKASSAPKNSTGAPSTTPSSANSADYVLVERPRSSRTIEAEKA